MSIKAKIKEIKASGALVELENGDEGWLSGMEISLNYNPNLDLRKQDLCSLNQVLEVVPFSKELGKNRLLVSHIRVNNDPWEKVKKWRSGDLKEFEVYSVTKNFVFGKIESGIEAYIALSDFTKQSSLPESLNSFLKISPGDSIAGYVIKEDIDIDNRLIHLDFISYVEDNKKISDFLPILDRANFDNLSNKSNYKIAEVNTKYIKIDSINNIFVLENEDIILNGIVNYLRVCGYTVYHASNEEECRNFLTNKEIDIDLSIIDIHLTAKNDYFGLTLLAILIEKQPRSKFILISAEEISPFKNHLAGELLISGYLIKPFGSEELRNAISSASQNDPKKLSSIFDAKNFKTNQNYFEPKSVETLRGSLEKFKEEINAEKVIVFKIHPLSYEVAIVELTDPRRIPNSLISKLRYSPVKDVSINREIINTGKVLHQPIFPKHRYLYNVITYESCLAFPLDAPSEYAYSLFVFHSKKYNFDQNDYYRTKVFAHELSLIIKDKRNEEIRKIDNPFLLAGKTYASMAHELMNNLSGEFSLNDIINQLNANKIDDNAIKEITINAKELLDKLVRAKEIISEFRTFSKSHRSETPSEVPVNEVIEKVERYLINEARLNNIRLNINIIENKPLFTKIRKTAIEQVVFNVVLNAIDQIKSFKLFRQEGAVLIELSLLEHEDDEWVQILIHDTGPGIHKRDFNNIFTTGFTTKVDGSGLGLDICRNIVINAGGKIGVLKSILFIGTTFQVLLPHINIKKQL